MCELGIKTKWVRVKGLVGLGRLANAHLSSLELFLTNK